MISEGMRVRVVPNRYGKEVSSTGATGVVTNVSLGVASVRPDVGRPFIVGVEFLDEVDSEEARRG